MHTKWKQCQPPPQPVTLAVSTSDGRFAAQLSFVLLMPALWLGGTAIAGLAHALP